MWNIFFNSNVVILNSFFIKITKFMRKNKHILYIWASGRPGTVGPNRSSNHNNPLKGYRVVRRLCFRPGGPPWHDPFHFHSVLGLISEGTSPAHPIGHV
jgi:hypothetical protein